MLLIHWLLRSKIMMGMNMLIKDIRIVNMTSCTRKLDKMIKKM